MLESQSSQQLAVELKQSS